MAQVDSSIFFQQQPIDVSGSITKGLNMADMIYQRQQQRKEQQKQQDLKDAFNAGITQNPDGSISHDPTKTISAIANLAKNPNSAVGGQDLVQAQQQFASQAAQQAEAKQKKQQADAAYTFQSLDPAKVRDQASWIAAKQQAIKDGHLEAAQLPDQYDPNLQKQLLDHAQRLALTPEQFSSLQERQQTHADARAERGLKRDEMANNKQIAELDKIGSRLEQMRGSPAAAQAEKDIYAAQKVNSLVNLYGDPNKLNPQQVQLVASEVAKIASGGVPSIHELEGLNPSTIPKSLAELAQKFANKPIAADQGAFVKAMKDYTDSLTKDAKAVISDRYGRILKPYESTYGKHPVFQGYQDQYLNRFNQQEQLQNSHPQDDQAVQWAKSNPNDPRAAQILKANGL